MRYSRARGESAPAQIGLERVPERDLIGPRRALVGDAIHQGVVLVALERVIEGEIGARDPHGFANFLARQIDALGDLVHGRLASQLLAQRAHDLADSIQRPRPISGSRTDARLLASACSMAWRTNQHRYERT